MYEHFIVIHCQHFAGVRMPKVICLEDMLSNHLVWDKELIDAILRSIARDEPVLVLKSQ